MTQILIDGKTNVYGIIGNPVSHSFSPNMHSNAFRHVGINSVYLPFPIEQSDLPQVLESFRVLGIQGFNVTIPYKEAIVPFLPEIDPAAKILRSVNTVKRTKNGWKGYSTDGSGFLRALQEKGVNPVSQSVLLIGAGGAARAIALAMVDAGIKELHIQNRTKSRAQELADLILKRNRKIVLKINPKDIKCYDILINCTSIGMDGISCPVSDNLIAASKQVIDIIYNPSLTPLLKKARSRGIDCDNGIGMLLYQGIEAFEIWTGEKAPIEVMEKSLKKSLEFQ